MGAAPPFPFPPTPALPSAGFEGPVRAEEGAVGGTVGGAKEGAGADSADDCFWRPVPLPLVGLLPALPAAVGSVGALAAAISSPSPATSPSAPVLAPASAPGSKAAEPAAAWPEPWLPAPGLFRMGGSWAEAARLGGSWIGSAGASQVGGGCVACEPPSAPAPAPAAVPAPAPLPSPAFAPVPSPAFASAEPFCLLALSVGGWLLEGGSSLQAAVTCIFNRTL